MILVIGLSFFLIMLIGAPIMTSLGMSAAMALQSGDLVAARSSRRWHSSPWIRSA